jgi:methionyl-tRNA formyltransferase
MDSSGPALNVVFIGSGRFGVGCLEAIAGSRHRLRLVVTAVPRPAGRGRKTVPTAVAGWASRSGVELLETADVNDPAGIEAIRLAEPDLVVVIACGWKLSSRLVDLPPKGTINVHASLLPKYRGAAPVNWAIINNERTTGVTVLTVTGKMDAGLILGHEGTEIGPRETAGELHDRLAALAPAVLMEVIDRISDGTAVGVKQDETAVSMAPKLGKEDGFIDFAGPAAAVAARIRGLWPWPGATAVYTRAAGGGATRVILASAEPVDCAGRAGLPAGSLDERLNVVCGSGCLKVLRIKPAGGRLMDFEDFANGRRIKAGDKFVEIEG